MNKLSRNFRSAAMVAVILWSWSAGAEVFTITTGSWSLGTGWGAACLLTPDCDSSHQSLNVNWATDGGLAQSFSLNPGESLTVTFGTALWSEEDNKIESGEIDNLDVKGVLNLSAPPLSGIGSDGVVVAITGSTADSANDLTVTFASVTVDFGFGGQFQVDFSDPAWDCNPSQVCVAPSSESQIITAKFTLITASGATDDPPARSVPEPNTVALAALGLLSLTFLRRRQQA